MKKYIMLLLVIGITLFMPMSTKAEIAFQQYDSDIETLNSIKADSEKLISYANETLNSNYEAKDIKFEEAVKVYTDIDLFQNKQMSNDILEKSILNANSVWFLPIYDNDKTIGLTITKGRPVTDDIRDVLDEKEIEQLEANVGKWIVSEITVEDMYKPYKQLIKEIFEYNQINDGKVYILGGTVNCRELLAINCSENNGCNIIKLYDISNNPQSLEDSEKVIYSYEKMRALVNQNKIGIHDIDNKNLYILIIIIPLLVLGLTLYYKGIIKNKIK